MKPGGRFVFNLVYPYTFGRWFRAAMALEPHNRTTWHRRYYTEGQLRAIARQSGFDAVQFEREGRKEGWSTWRRA